MDKRDSQRSPLFRIRAGLPAYGPRAHGFPVSFDRSGREGFVVEFLPDTPDVWIGNFGPGLGSYDGICVHPNGSDVVIFASGQGYVVDPRTRELKEEIGGAVGHLWAVDEPPGFILDQQGLAFLRVGPRGLYWHTRRLSWDGFKDLVFSEARIVGQAWNAVDERWLPFEVDVATGRSRGGAYSAVDIERWEQLAKR